MRPECEAEKAATHKGRIYQFIERTAWFSSAVVTTQMKYIGFIERFERELTAMLNAHTEVPAIVKWASDRVFESYRNGVEVGKNGRKSLRNDRQEGARPQAK